MKLEVIIKTSIEDETDRAKFLAEAERLANFDLIKKYAVRGNKLFILFEIEL